MEVLFVFICIVAFLVWVGKINAKNKEEKEREIQLAREERLAGERELEKKLTGVNTPERILALCSYEPPRNIRFLKTEKPVWVLPECVYFRTVKEVTYRGGSTGASFRVAKGVSVRTSGSRGRREENESLQAVDTGTAVLTDKHLYFSGTDKERFRVRLEKLVTAEAIDEGFLFQRDGVRARPEAFVSDDAHLLAIVLAVVENDYTGDFEPEPDSVEPQDGVEVIAAHQASTESY